MHRLNDSMPPSSSGHVYDLVREAICQHFVNRGMIRQSGGARILYLISRGRIPKQCLSFTSRALSNDG